MRPILLAFLVILTCWALAPAGAMAHGKMHHGSDCPGCPEATSPQHAISGDRHQPAPPPADSPCEHGAACALQALITVPATAGTRPAPARTRWHLTETSPSSTIPSRDPLPPRS